jgi:hypothetical protein
MTGTATPMPIPIRAPVDKPCDDGAMLVEDGAEDKRGPVAEVEEFVFEGNIDGPVMFLGSNILHITSSEKTWWLPKNLPINKVRSAIRDQIIHVYDLCSVHVYSAIIFDSDQDRKTCQGRQIRVILEVH